MVKANLVISALAGTLLIAGCSSKTMDESRLVAAAPVNGGLVGTGNLAQDWEHCNQYFRELSDMQPVGTASPSLFYACLHSKGWRRR
jgi:hypothetical protein